MSRVDLGDEIRRRRKERKLRQSDLAKLAAVATTNVGKIEKGTPVSPTTMRAVARALELPAEMLAPYLSEAETPAKPAEPNPGDYPDAMEYLNAQYWYMREGLGMSHEAVMRGLNMASAIYERRKAERVESDTNSDKFG